MASQNNKSITVQTEINAPEEQVWRLYTEPEHIKQWNNASDDWHTIKAENDLRVGGKFLFRMEAKDGSSGFDFSGIYDKIKDNEIISYTMDDKRKVRVEFHKILGGVKIIVKFDAENENSIELQKEGWQAILNNFKTFVEKIQ